jgi:dGTPase
MVLFDNDFYSDEDCCDIVKTSKGWRTKPFSRQTTSETKMADRTPFQVDLDRLTFSEAFRRLQGKTQVRRTGPKSFSRTRLSHSIEVARIARSIVTKIHIMQGLPFGQFIDPDLVEFACFAHDIGNPPFGHAGERELNRQMQKHGGFEGNAQSLRIVTEIAWNSGGIEPTRAGTDAILKYKDLWSEKSEPEETRRQFLYDYQGQLLKYLDVKRGRSTECQIMNLADDIGNGLIDFTDGVRTGIITEEKVKALKKKGLTTDFASRSLLQAFQTDMREKFSAVRVRDCIKEIEIARVAGGTNRYGYDVCLSPTYANFIDALRQINKNLLFKDPDIRASDNEGAFILRTLFDIIRSHYVDRESDVLFKKAIIAKDWHTRLQKADQPTKFRIICDYLSSMTDDYAQILFKQAIEVAL